VASFRDPLQPELVRFPGLWRTRILAGAGLFFAALTAVLGWWFASPTAPSSWKENTVLLGLALWLAACWPREIVCGPVAAEQRQWLGLRKVRIRWDEDPALERKQEFLGLGRWLGLAASVIELSSPAGVIRHTPRHADAERFVQECRRRMEESQQRRAAAGRATGAAPAAEKGKQ